MAVGAAWDPRMKAMIERLNRMSASKEPFELSPGSTVIDPEKFHAAMLSEAAEGPKTPRCRTGAFQKDLERYLEIKGKTSS